MTGQRGHETPLRIVDETHWTNAACTEALPAPLPPAELERCRPPRVWPGGVRRLGPLLLIPGRTLDISRLDEAEQHVASVTEAIAELRDEFPEQRS